ncbi:pectin lyase-like protein [Thelephora ganbajun]|uniref:Pectin lyase-like protein n=1 Tax=Thelephora ganbajun TaxID=370292 RepID=A0ACB6Z9W8_THEGA|nr:pectin lyase-like protein [Thelephora ganbajun]
MHLLRLASALSSVSLTLAWATYIVPHSAGNDDTPALAAAFFADPKLATNATILFEQGVTYNILTPIRFPYFENVLVSVQGNLTYAANIQNTQAIVGSSDFPGHWFTFTGGSNVTLEGSEDPQWGWVDSHGQQWWDAMQEVSLRVNRPHGWGFQKITNGEIKYMKLWQPVAWSFSASGSKNLHIHHNTIIAISNNKTCLIGFAAQGTNLLFEDNTIFNGDDCLTVGSPADNIHFRNSYCNGGHGLSIGSLGKGGAVADVRNVLIENIDIDDSLYGARFKSWAGGKGTARNVTWKDIRMKKVRLPLGPKPKSTTANSTLIDTFTFENFRGTIDDNTNPGVSGATGKEVAIFDLYQGTAKAIIAKNVSMTTLSGAPVTVICDSTVITTDVGFKCWNGLFQPTAVGE